MSLASERPMRKLNSLILLIVVGLLVNCGASESSNPPVSATTEVTIQLQGISSLAAIASGIQSLAPAPSDIPSITVEVTADDITPPLIATIIPTPGQPVTVTMSVPSGLHRIFTAKAYDVSNVIRYTGQTIADLPVGGSTTVTIEMNAIDSTPPQVLFVSPPDGAADVTLGVTLTARFSEALDATTVNIGTFTLTSGDGFVSGVVTYDPVTRTASLDPTADLAVNTVYTATLTTGIKDLFGNSLSQAYSFSFTTNPGASVELNFPPVITTITPSNGAIEVSIRPTIAATFNAEMDATTINTNTFWLQSQTGFVAGTVSYDAATKIASFQPSSDLAFNTLYAVTVSMDVKDSSGRAMGQDYTWTFTTDVAVLGTPTIINAIPGDLTLDRASRRVAVDGHGNAIAVWSQGHIWANRYTVSTGWGTPVIIDTDAPHGMAANPRLGMDSDGNAIAVWSQSEVLDGAPHSIWTNRYVVGAGWETATLLETDTGSAILPDVAVDASGDALAVWSQFDGAFYSILATRYVVGTGWGTPTLIETHIMDAFYPYVAMDSLGNATVGWVQSADESSLTANSIWVNRYVVGTGWGIATQLDTNNTSGGSVGFHRIAMDDTGNAVVVWQQYDAGLTIYNIYASHYIMGTGWSTAIVIETSSSTAFRPAVDMDGAGNAIAVWYQVVDGTSHSVWANRYVEGIGWSTPTLLREGRGVASFPDIAFAPDGNAVAVWSQRDASGNHSIYANRYARDVGWNGVTLLESNSGTALQPDVEADSSGNAIAVWQQSDGTQYNIWANRFALTP